MSNMQLNRTPPPNWVNHPSIYGSSISKQPSKSISTSFYKNYGYDFNDDISRIDMSLSETDEYGRMSMTIEIFLKRVQEPGIIIEPITLDLFYALSGKEMIYHIERLFNLPLSEMPLYINDDCSLFKKIAMWRLNCSI